MPSFCGFFGLFFEGGKIEQDIQIFVKTAVFFFSEKTISSGVEYQRRYEEREGRKRGEIKAKSIVSRLERRRASFAEKSFDDDRGRERFFVVGFDRE